MNKPLSKRQKAVLSQLAARAWRLFGDSWGIPSAEDFRHSCVQRACSKPGLTACTQQDYVPLYNHLARLLGLRPIEDNTPHSPEEALIWTIRDRMRHWDIPAPYVAAIIHSKFSIAYGNLDSLLARLPASSLRQLLYTLEARARSKAQRTSAQLGLDSPVEVHSSPSTLPPTRLAQWRGDILAKNPSTR